MTIKYLNNGRVWWKKDRKIKTKMFGYDWQRKQAGSPIIKPTNLILSSTH